MARVELSDIHARPAARAPAALHGLSLAIRDGVVGLIGPNGAGKTTLLRLLLGAVLPLRGRVALDGLAPEAYRSRRPLGFLPEKPALPEWLTVGEFLDGVAEISSPAPAALLDGVASLRDRRLGQLSLGQHRRVELVAALCGDPDLVLMDEPTNGLDPLAVGLLRDTVLGSRRPGRTIIVSSHHLDELQRVVDAVVLLREGSLRGMWQREAALAEYGSFDHLFHSVFGATSPAPVEAR